MSGRPERDGPSWDGGRAAFVESASREFAAAGFPALPARVIMALTATDEGRLTAEELMRILGVSRAAISGAITLLGVLGYVRTTTVRGSRRHVYALPDRPWYTSTLTRPELYHHIAEVIAAGAADIPAGAARERIEEMADFFVYLENRLPELLREWQERRGR